MNAEKSLVRIPELDGLRGLAALSVLVPHFLTVWAPDARSNFHPVLARIINIGDYGIYGVDLFFVLSGFLISSLLIADRQSPLYFRDFYWKRALRILPVYLAHLALTMLLFPKWQGYVLLSLVFLVNFAGPLHTKALGPTWSLSIEEQFYLLWPQALRRMQTKHLYYLAFGLVLSSNVLRILVHLYHGGVDDQYTFYRCDGLAFGALIAFRKFLPLQENRIVRRGLAFFQSNLLLIAVLAVTIAVIARDGNSVMARQLKLTTSNLLFYRVVGFAVFHRGRTLRWLASPVAVYVGSISYALYMYESIVIIKAEMWLGHIPPSHIGAICVRAILVLTVCLVLCTISRYAIELPAQRLRRFVLRRREPAPILVPDDQLPVAVTAL
jgi:peptidoglycan/LPS O-acetylase OafA/YrhL